MKLRTCLAFVALLSLTHPSAASALLFQHFADLSVESPLGGDGVLVQPLPGGGAVVAWARDNGNHYLETDAEVFSADGTPHAAITGCSEDTNRLGALHPRLLGLGDGSFLYGCTVVTNDAWALATYRRYTMDGSPDGPRYQFATPKISELHGFTMVDGGSYLVSNSECDASNCYERKRRYDLGGAELDHFHYSRFDHSVVWPLAPQRLLVLRRHGMGKKERLVVTDEVGRRLGGGFALALRRDGGLSTTDVRSNGAGRTAVLATMNASRGPGPNFVVRTFSGLNVDASMRIETVLPKKAQNWSSAWVFPLKSGYVLVGWQPMFAQRFSADGQPVGKRAYGPADGSGFGTPALTASGDAYLLPVARRINDVTVAELWRLDVEKP